MSWKVGVWGRSDADGAGWIDRDQVLKSPEGSVETEDGGWWGGHLYLNEVPALGCTLALHLMCEGIILSILIPEEGHSNHVCKLRKTTF